MKNKIKYTILVILILSIFVVTSCKENAIMPDITNVAEITTEEEIETPIEDILGCEMLSFSEKFVLADVPVGDEWSNYFFNTERIQVIKKTDGTFAAISGEIIEDNGDTSTIKTIFVSDGHLISINYGEFYEDGFYFRNHEGEFFDLPIRAVDHFYKLGKDIRNRGEDEVIYYITPSGHIYRSVYIGRIVKENGMWKNDDGFLIDLSFNNEFPIPRVRTFLVDYETVYMIVNYAHVNSKLIALKDGIATVLWDGIRANSIICIDNLLYLGSHGGIASYNLDTGEQLWYEKN